MSATLWDALGRDGMSANQATGYGAKHQPQWPTPFTQYQDFDSMDQTTITEHDVEGARQALRYFYGNPNMTVPKASNPTQEYHSLLEAYTGNSPVFVSMILQTVTTTDMEPFLLLPPLVTNAKRINIEEKIYMPTGIDPGQEEAPARTHRDKSSSRTFSMKRYVKATRHALEFFQTTVGQVHFLATMEQIKTGMLLTMAQAIMVSIFNSKPRLTNEIIRNPQTQSGAMDLHLFEKMARKQVELFAAINKSYEGLDIVVKELNKALSDRDKTGNIAIIPDGVEWALSRRPELHNALLSGHPLGTKKVPKSANSFVDEVIGRIIRTRKFRLGSDSPGNNEDPAFHAATIGTYYTMLCHTSKDAIPGDYRSSMRNIRILDCEKDKLVEIELEDMLKKCNLFVCHSDGKSRREEYDDGRGRRGDDDDGGDDEDGGELGRAMRHYRYHDSVNGRGPEGKTPRYPLTPLGRKFFDGEFASWGDLFDDAGLLEQVIRTFEKRYDDKWKPFKAVITQSAPAAPPSSSSISSSSRGNAGQGFASSSGADLGDVDFGTGDSKVNDAVNAESRGRMRTFTADTEFLLPQSIRRLRSLAQTDDSARVYLPAVDGYLAQHAHNGTPHLERNFKGYLMALAATLDGSKHAADPIQRQTLLRWHQLLVRAQRIPGADGEELAYLALTENPGAARYTDLPTDLESAKSRLLALDVDQRETMMNAVDQKLAELSASAGAGKTDEIRNTLMSTRITSGDGFFWLIKNNIKCPISLMLANPWGCWKMGDMIKMQAGGETGNLFLSNAVWTWGSDTITRNMNGLVSVWFKPFIREPGNIAKLRNVYCCDYLGGGSTEVFHPQNQAHRELVRQGNLERELTTMPGLFVIALPPRCKNLKPMMDICGFYNRTHVLNQPAELHYPTAALYRDFWNFRHDSGHRMTPDDDFTAPRTSHYNTIVFQGTQLQHDHRDSDGAGIVHGVGHWGKSIYDGVVSARIGEQRWIRDMNRSGEAVSPPGMVNGP